MRAICLGAFLVFSMADARAGARHPYQAEKVPTCQAFVSGDRVAKAWAEGLVTGINLHAADKLVFGNSQLSQFKDHARRWCAESASGRSLLVSAVEAYFETRDGKDVAGHQAMLRLAIAALERDSSTFPVSVLFSEEDGYRADPYVCSDLEHEQGKSWLQGWRSGTLISSPLHRDVFFEEGIGPDTFLEQVARHCTGEERLSSAAQRLYRSWFAAVLEREDPERAGLRQELRARRIKLQATLASLERQTRTPGDTDFAGLFADLYRPDRSLRDSSQQELYRRSALLRKRYDQFQDPAVKEEWEKLVGLGIKAAKGRRRGPLYGTRLAAEVMKSWYPDPARLLPALTGKVLQAPPVGKLARTMKKYANIVSEIEAQVRELSILDQGHVEEDVDDGGEPVEPAFDPNQDRRTVAQRLAEEKIGWEGLYGGIQLINGYAPPEQRGLDVGLRTAGLYTRLRVEPHRISLELVESLNGEKDVALVGIPMKDIVTPSEQLFLEKSRSPLANWELKVSLASLSCLRGGTDCYVKFHDNEGVGIREQIEGAFRAGLGPVYPADFASVLESQIKRPDGLKWEGGPPP